MWESLNGENLNVLVAPFKFIHENLKERQKVFFENITTILLIQLWLIFIHYQMQKTKNKKQQQNKKKKINKTRDLHIDCTLGNCLFGAVNITKNADPDKHGYSGCGTEYDARSQFSLLEGSSTKNVINFGTDDSSSVHVEVKRKIT